MKKVMFDKRVFNKKTADILISIGIVGAFFAFMLSRYTFTLQSDDAQMRAIASGAFTGHTDGHLVFMKYVLGVFISSLYNVFPEYNCYGIFFFGLIAGVMVLYCTYFLEERSYFQAILFAALFIIIIIPLILELNFTYSAVIVGSLALFYQIIDNYNSKKSKVFFVLSLWLCYCIRYEVFFMMLPFLLLDVVYKAILHTSDRKVFIKEVAKPYLCVLILLLITVIVEKTAYSSEEWRKFIEYNNNRTQVIDYSDWPGYAENQDMYLKYGIDENKYELLDYSRLSISGVDMESLMNDVVKVLKQEKTVQEIKNNLITACYQMYNGFFGKEYSLVNIIIVALLSACLMFGLINNNSKYYIWKIILSYIGYLLIWFALVYAGRPIFRVCVSLQIVMLIFLCGEFIKNWKIAVRCVDKVTGLKTFCIGVTAFLIFNVLNIANDKSIDHKKIINDQTTISKYCEKYSNNVYFVHGSEYAFSQDNSLKNVSMSNNVIYPGGWITNSPLFKEQINNHGIQDVFDDLISADNVYYIDKNEKQCDIILKYYNSMEKLSLYEAVDSVGDNYQILEPLKVYQFSYVK